jgi:hypothetical protein
LAGFSSGHPLDKVSALAHNTRVHTMANDTPIRRSVGSTFLVNSLIRLFRLGMLATFLVLLYFAYRYSLHNLLYGSFALGFLVLWVLVAYITLPRIHRWLTRIYLPDYYMGRSRTSEGLLGDSINIAIRGGAKQLREAMLAAGWVEADRPKLGTILHLIRASLLSQDYPAAPGSTQYLFGYRSAYSFQKGEHGHPRDRHHVRIWKTPTNWWLPGGYTADWLGAVHHDRAIGLSLFTGQFTHRIHQDIDSERDLLVADLKATGRTAKVQVVPHFSSGYHTRNGGGDRIRTDGAMPFIDLR